MFLLPQLLPDTIHLPTYPTIFSTLLNHEMSEKQETTKNHPQKTKIKTSKRPISQKNAKVRKKKVHKNIIQLLLC